MSNADNFLLRSPETVTSVTEIFLCAYVRINILDVPKLYYSKSVPHPVSVCRKQHTRFEFHI